jgi:AcrR family transcriptional regulator
VLEVAYTVFATEGLSVPVHEIARRAGVGTGTVSRHFPTKESLFVAVLLSRIERLVDEGRYFAATEEPGAAFFKLFSALVEEGAANRAVSDALSGAGFNIGAMASRGEHDVMGLLRDLLRSAQRSGEVRNDVDVLDVHALVVGCLAREGTPTDSRARRRLVVVVTDGLRSRNESARVQPTSRR